jgi:murein DD-endopeptidase MepM/ murein hydrolase activator NlpD
MTSGAAQAQVPLALHGHLMQGALVIGQTVPGATVTLDGKPIEVDRTGAFALGFGRDAKPGWSLVVTAPGGASLTRPLAIAQRHYRVQRINGIDRKYVEPPPALMKRLTREYFLVRKAREADTDQPFWRTGFIWPVKGRISGVYGSQRIIDGKPLRPHYGVDIAAPAGTPIHAAAGGTVTLAEPDLFFTGRTVIIDHGLGVSTLYVHMSALYVKVGDHVRQGQVIGLVGATGRATGPHLHWGLNWHQDYLDAATVVGPMWPRAAHKKRR